MCLKVRMCVFIEFCFSIANLPYFPNLCMYVSVQVGILRCMWEHWHVEERNISCVILRNVAHLS